MRSEIFCSTPEVDPQELKNEAENSDIQGSLTMSSLSITYISKDF